MEKTFHKIVRWKKKGRQTTKEKEEKKELDGESLKIQEIEGQYSYSDLIFRPS